VPHTTAPAIQPPWTRDEIIAQFVDLHQQTLRFWSGFDTSTFVAPIGDGWSPANHVRHLTKAMRALTRGLLIARFKLLLRFGWTLRGSRTYDEIRETYLSRLPAFKGSNPFAPRLVDVIDDPETWRNSVMLQYDTSLHELTSAITKWSERSLDHFRLPHILMGKLTVREMLFFVLYHNLHHVNGVTRKLS
jgi:hypothetical protein